MREALLEQQLGLLGGLCGHEVPMRDVEVERGQVLAREIRREVARREEDVSVLGSHRSYCPRLASLMSSRPSPASPGVELAALGDGGLLIRGSHTLQHDQRRPEPGIA